jgi:hypothetical protein
MSSTRPSKSGKALTTEEWDCMKAAGFTDEELHADQPFGPIVYSYSRAQAIEDGVLIDLTAAARPIGFKTSVVCTAEVWSHVTVPDAAKEGEGQTEAARLGDLLRLLACAIVSRPTKPEDPTRIDFKCRFVVAPGKSEDVDFYALCGPGDDAEPVITIMMPWED